MGNTVLKSKQMVKFCACFRLLNRTLKYKIICGWGIVFFPRDTIALLPTYLSLFDGVPVLDTS